MNQHTLLPKKTERLQYFGSVSPIKGEKPVEKEKMKDLQNIRKDYFFDIQHVGVANVSHPVTITSAMMPAEQTTAANFTMTCNLPRNQKGINMSRLTELLQVYHQNGWILSFSSLQQFTKELAENMDTSSATVEVRFPWFFERKSPKLAFYLFSLLINTSCQKFTQGTSLHYVWRRGAFSGLSGA